MSKAVVILLRTLLAIFFALALLIQFFAIPGLITDIKMVEPEFAHLALPYGIPAFLAFVCVEVVLVAMWMLLGLVRTGTVFSERAFRWVTTIIWATWTAVGLSLIPIAYSIVYALSVDTSETTGSPAASIALVIVILGGAAFALLMTVMRALLRQATDARAELEEVI